MLAIAKNHIKVGDWIEVGGLSRQVGNIAIVEEDEELEIQYYDQYGAHIVSQHVGAIHGTLSPKKVDPPPLKGAKNHMTDEMGL